jgi:uncharacterized protein YbjT (DUF2867 family)
MILVAGATGQLGLEVCRQLLARGEAVRALARASSSAAQIAILRGLGAALAQGDLHDRASLDVACAGVSAVITTASVVPFGDQPAASDMASVDVLGRVDLIEAARRAGVSQFIYTSLSRNMALDFPLKRAKRLVEERLKRSGLCYTILRPSFIMEAWLAPALGFDYWNGKARIYGSGDNPISFVSLRDVAAFAVESLGHPAGRDAILELGGPAALSPKEVVGLFEQVSGQAFDLAYVPEEMLREQQEATTDPIEQSLAGLKRCYARGDVIPMRLLLDRFPLRLTSVQGYAEAVLSAEMQAAA